jgi:hypothetical protein
MSLGRGWVGVVVLGAIMLCRWGKGLERDYLELPQVRDQTTQQLLSTIRVSCWQAFYSGLYSAALIAAVTYRASDSHFCIGWHVRLWLCI